MSVDNNEGFIHIEDLDQHALDAHRPTIDERNRVNVTLSTDIIVGFPGETEEQFLDTVSLLETVRYDGAFTFVYSPRAGTPATRLADDVSEEEKKNRLYRLNQVQERITGEKAQELEGKIIEVLVEGDSKNNPDVLQARTDSNKLVHIHGSKHLIGQFVYAKITESKTWYLLGELVPEGVTA